MHAGPTHTHAQATPIIVDKRTQGRGQLEAVIHWIPARQTQHLSEATHVIIMQADYDVLVEENHPKAADVIRKLWDLYRARTLISDEYLEVLAGARAPVPMDEFTYTIRAPPTRNEPRSHHPHRASQPAYQPRSHQQLAESSSGSSPQNAVPPSTSSLPAAPASQSRLESPQAYAPTSPRKSTSPSASAAPHLPLDSPAGVPSPSPTRRTSPERTSSSSIDTPPSRLPKRGRSEDLSQPAAEPTHSFPGSDEGEDFFPAVDHRTPERPVKRSRTTADDTVDVSLVDPPSTPSPYQQAVVSMRGPWIKDRAVVLRCCRAQLSTHELLLVVNPHWEVGTMHNSLNPSRLANSLLDPQTDNDARRRAFVLIFGRDLFHRAWLEYAAWSNAYLTPRSDAVRTAMTSWLDDLEGLQRRGTKWPDIMGIHYDIHSEYAKSHPHFVAVDFVLYLKAALTKMSMTSNINAASSPPHLGPQPQSPTIQQRHGSGLPNCRTGDTMASSDRNVCGGDSGEPRDAGHVLAGKDPGT